MSAHVLLNLLNKLGKRDKMRGLSSILSLFRNEFNKFINTRARMLDSIYHMTLGLGSIRVNTDDFYTPMFHKPLSLFGRGYSLRCRFLYLRNVISVPCNKRTDDIWFGNQTIKQKCK